MEITANLVAKPTSPLYCAVADLLEASPLPWSATMLREWFGWSEYKANKYPYYMAARGYITKVAPGMFTANGRVPVEIPALPPLSTATFSSRGPSDVITDEVLARYGYNL